MKKAALTHVVLSLALFAGQAVADDCKGKPSKEARDIHKNLKDWMTKSGAVEYTGYVARKVVADPNLACADRELFEELLEQARESVPKSKMISGGEERPVRLTTPIVDYPQRMAEQMKDGECTVTYDLPRAGPPQNVKAVCNHEGFVEMSENAVRSVVAAPLTIDDEFIPQTGMSYPITYDIR